MHSGLYLPCRESHVDIFSLSVGVPTRRIYAGGKVLSHGALHYRPSPIPSNVSQGDHNRQTALEAFWSRVVAGVLRKIRLSELTLDGRLSTQSIQVIAVQIFSSYPSRLIWRAACFYLVRGFCKAARGFSTTGC